MTLPAAIARTFGRPAWMGVIVLGVALLVSTATQAQNASPRWPELSAAEQRVLRPLQDQWQDIDATRKLKWRELAQRYPNLPPDQQSRIRERMVEWAQLSAAERNAARLRYQAVKSLPDDERRAKWEAYKSLSEDERRALAGRAETRTTATQASADHPAKRAGVNQLQPKSNIVEPQTAGQAKPAGLGIVQAGVGASTRPINQRPQPPSHQLVGQPKIAATPEYVDRATLLPQHEPQASAIEPRRASQ